MAFIVAVEVRDISRVRYGKLKPYGLPEHACVDGFSMKIPYIPPL